MALLNPVYAFLVPFLVIVTVPLAIFAGITTTVAFTVLILRVLAVYIDVALSLVPGYLGGRKPRQLRYAASTGSPPNGGSISPVSTPLRSRRRHRRSSSALSAGTATPLGEGAPTTLGLMPSIGPERDFEGIGGWRINTGDDDDLWTTINSRLELPDKQHCRNHHRSPSGPTTPGDGGYLMMKKGRSPPSPEVKRVAASPNSSRTRTPSGPRMGFIPGKSHAPDGYFPMIKTSPKKRLSPPGLVDA